MKTLVTYQSKTGFTKKYAQWIAEELSADIEDVSKITKEKASDYALIIHGGWIMGGMINGLEKVKTLEPKKLIIFGVGYTEENHDEISIISEKNKIEDTPLFYYRGGMDPKKMGFFGRMIIKMVTKKTPVYIDYTQKEKIDELIKVARGMNECTVG